MSTSEKTCYGGLIGRLYMRRGRRKTGRGGWYNECMFFEKIYFEDVVVSCGFARLTGRHSALQAA